jgi:formylglycine-generating enzyme required for sulfatase activity
LPEEAETVPEGLTEEQAKELARKFMEKGDKLREDALYEDALAEYKKAEKAYPDLPNLQYDLGGVYWQLGNKKEALKHLDRCLSLIPPNHREREDIERYVAMLEKSEVGLKPQEKEKRLQEREEERNRIMKDAVEKNKAKWSEMVFIPAGTFTMGEDPYELISENAREEETPKRDVYLDAFYIDKYEVTNALYWEFLDYIKRTGDHSKCHPNEPKNKDHTPEKWFEDRYFDHPDYPVNRVDWYDAYAFAAWAGKRLPTEAEWEKAARGTDARRFPWGDVFSASRVNWGATGPLSIGSYTAGKSVYGCEDMAGGVIEWCSDWFERKYYSWAPTTNPKGPEKSSGVRAMRGGSLFANSAYLLRCSKRSFGRPDERNKAVGIRCAADAK